ncbi:MAG: CinA family nicotinamide mononucleotide deamidase-related protein [Flavobacteriaceae bacterium]|nr:CinA family nicotinamide mononucleotide deamidase-related protein [Flavobacteriaceae bacterium]
MICEIISIGDEILIGQIVNTNSVFISKELNKIGVEVVKITSISDKEKTIIDSLDLAKKNSDLIIMTGGLGPTNDDITKHALCKYFGDALEENRKVLKNIEKIFEKYVSTPMSKKNRDQSLVPSKAKILNNSYGTAPGLWFTKDNISFISLPGVPFEMKEILINQVIPELRKKSNRIILINKTILTYGLGESFISEKIKDWEKNLPFNMKLAYLPNLGRVRLRLSIRGKNRDLLNNKINNQIKKLYSLIGDIIVGIEGETSIEQELLKKFKKNKITLSLAESCTGGNIAARITKIPGSSVYYKGGIIPYNTKIKQEILKIPVELINDFSVVSQEVAKVMALRTKSMFKSNISLAVTGNAGPSKGDSEEPIGTVYICIVNGKKVINYKFNYGKHRERVIEKAVNKSLELLLLEVSG